MPDIDPPRPPLSNSPEPRLNEQPSDLVPVRDPWDAPHADKATFVRDVASAVRSIAPISPQQYKEVSVLLIRWQNDNIGTETEINDLDYVFRELYHYNIERFFIPSTKNAQYELSNAVSKFVQEHNDPSNLLVIYYGGHSQRNHLLDSIWTETDLPRTWTLNWSAIQPMVLTAEPDVLLMLDCCYAAKAATRGSANGSKELLAACASQDVTTGLADNSWTRVLIDELNEAAHCGITAYQLQDNLLLRQKVDLDYQPQFHPLSHHKAPRIKLYPMDRSPLLTDASTVSEGSEMRSGGRILIGIHFRELHLPRTVKAWRDELTEYLPEYMSKITVEFQPKADLNEPIRRLTKRLTLLQTDEQPWSGMDKHKDPKIPSLFDDNEVITPEGDYESNSTLVLVSIPTSVWHYLPRNPAYQTIGYVKSKNAIGQPGLGRTNSDLLRQKLAEAHETIAKNPVYTIFVVNVIFILPLTRDVLLLLKWWVLLIQFAIIVGLATLQMRVKLLPKS